MNKNKGGYYENGQKGDRYNAKTIYDFDEDEVVVNFDEDPTNNFGVLAEDVKVITAEDVTLEDDGTYFVVNPSDSIEAGDKIMLSDDEEDFLFKAETVTSDNGDVRIVPSESKDEMNGFGLNDFYEYIKIDMETEEIAYQDDSDGNEIAIMSVSNDKIEENADGNKKVSKTHFIDLKKGSLSIDISIGVKLSFEVIWDPILFGEDYFKHEFKFSAGGNCSISVQTEQEEEKTKIDKEFSLGKITFVLPVPGLDASILPKFELNGELSGNVKGKGIFEFTSGHKFNTKDGVQKYSENEFSWEVSVDGELKVTAGLSPEVGVEFLGGVLTIKADPFIGFEAEAGGNAFFDLSKDIKHGCRLCLNVSVKGVLSIKIVAEYDILKFISKKNSSKEKEEKETENEKSKYKLKGKILDAEVLRVEIPFLEGYLSLINDKDSLFGGKIQCGVGECPNKAYRTVINVTRMTNQGIEYVDVPVTILKYPTGENVDEIDSGDDIYLYNGKYIANATVDGKDYRTVFTVKDKASTVNLASFIELSIDMPSRMLQGSTPNIVGSITSKFNITEITATITYAGYKEQSYTVYPNATSYSLGGSTLVKNLHFENLPFDQYTMYKLNVTALDESGTRDSITINFYVDPATYQISYNANGGSGSMSIQSVKNGESVTLNKNTFIRAGYNFNGWNTLPNGTGIAYLDEDTVKPTGNLTLYAQWNELSNLNISLDSFSSIMEGSAKNLSGSVTSDYPITKITASITYSSYTERTFTVNPNAKAYELKNSTLDFSSLPADIYTPYKLNITATDSSGTTKSITITFYVTPREYTISFNANGGSGSMSSQSKEIGESTTLPNNTFTRTNYTFTGWNTNPDGTGTAYKNEETITPTGNITLYAQWKKDASTLKISVDDIGSIIQGSAYGITGSIVSNYIITSVSATITYDGYPEQSTSVNPNVTSYSLGGSTLAKSLHFENLPFDQYTMYKLNITALDESGERDSITINFYVKPATHQISYNANGGSGSMSSQSVENGTSTTLQKNTFTRTNYTFTGWNTNPDGTGTAYKNGASITPTGNITLYAQWQKDPSTLKISVDDIGSIIQGSAYGITGSIVSNYIITSVSATIAYDGYPEQSTSVNPNVTSYSLGGSTLAKSLHFENLPFDQYTMYKLNITALDESGERDSITINFYVKPATYQISYNANGGSGSMSSQSVENGTSTTLQKNTFIRTNYTFTGWNTNPDGTGTAYKNGASITPTGNITLYAQWKKDASTLKVSVNSIGSIIQGSAYGITGSIASNYIITSVSATITYDGYPEQSTSVNPNVTSYSLGGSTLAKDLHFEDLPFDNSTMYKLNVTAVDESGARDSITINFYVEPSSYTITYKKNGGSGSMADQSVANGASATLQKNTFTRTGYSFTGWNTKADGSGTSYANRASITPTKNLKLYAQWKCTHSSVTCVSEGASRHYNQCTVCGEITSYSAHTYGSYAYYNGQNHKRVCTKCEYTEYGSHSMTYVNNGATGHDEKCTICGATTAHSAHTFGSYVYYSSEYHRRYCGLCGYYDYKSHSYSGWKYDATYHWRTCSVCNGQDKQSHSWIYNGSSKQCTVCGYG